MGRDDQFAGWAKVVFDQMCELKDWFIDVNGFSHEMLPLENMTEAYTDILASAAYDLAIHVASHVSEKAGALMGADMATPQEIVTEIPDMPEEQQNVD